jgi:hypothetical protein
MAGFFCPKYKNIRIGKGFSFFWLWERIREFFPFRVRLLPIGLCNIGKKGLGLRVFVL